MVEEKEVVEEKEEERMVEEREEERVVEEREEERVVKRKSALERLGRKVVDDYEEMKVVEPRRAISNKDARFRSLQERKKNEILEIFGSNSDDYDEEETPVKQAYRDPNNDFE